MKLAGRGEDKSEKGGESPIGPSRPDAVKQLGAVASLTKEERGHKKVSLEERTWHLKKRKNEEEEG